MGKKPIWLGLLAVMLALFITGCGWPKEFKKQVSAIPDGIKQAEARVNQLKISFENSKKTNDFKKLAQYASREKWTDNFTKAQDEINHANNVFSKDLTPLYEENKKENISKAKSHIDRINRARRSALELARKPGNRAELLFTVIKEAPQTVKKAEDETKQIKSIYTKFDEFSQKALADYPEKKKDINAKQASVKKTYENSNVALVIVNTEFKSNDSDYAQLADNAILVSNNLKAIKAQDRELRSTISELYRSYSKVLIDMKFDYYIQIGRTSWNESSDWNTEKNYKYNPRKVNEKIYEYFEVWPDGKDIATKGWGKRAKIDQAIWDSLNVDWKENWPSSSHGSATYWISDLPTYYYHKYLITENGVQKETDWEKVNDDYYEDNEDNLNMVLFSKPYGSYEKEVDKVASPPGYTYIAKPEMRDGRPHGSNQYGQWRTGNDGNSFWEFYGKYMFISHMMGGGHYYGYGRWNDWNYNYRGRTPYYGSGGNDRYGTYGSNTRSNSKYTKSHFAKKGGFKSQDSSVRGAGPGKRGGGPGKGGK